MEEDNNNQSQDEQIASNVEHVNQPIIPDHIQESLGKPVTSPAVAKVNNGPTWAMLVMVSVAVAVITGGAVYSVMRVQLDGVAKTNEVKKSTDISADDKVTIDSKGIATSKVTMYKVDSIQNATWVSDRSLDPDYSEQLISFTASSAVRTPIVSDMGNFRNNYKDKDWVAVEVKATDTRTSGQNRAIILRDSIRLVENGNKIPPLDDSLYIAPLESKTIYEFFPVSKTSNSFELWTGDLAKPSINNLDFSKGTKLNGFFLMKSGFNTKLQ